MKMYRFIGKAEFNALMNGETVYNTTDYSKKYSTNSKGFCFFQNNRTKKIDVIAESAMEYLDGIVDTYAIVCVEVEKARKARGFYSVGYKTEYNLTEYDYSVIIGAWLCNTHEFTSFTGHTYIMFDGVGEQVM